MRNESITADGITTTAAIPRKGVLVLTGYSIRVAVQRGHLVVSDGRGRERREGRFSRARRDLQRLVVLGHSGSITFDALRWLHDIHAAFVQLDADGTVIVANGPSALDDARLRRAQAYATSNGVGITIARDLLRSKLEGQAEVLSRLPESEDPIAVIDRALPDLPHASTPSPSCVPIWSRVLRLSRMDTRVGRGGYTYTVGTNRKQRLTGDLPEQGFGDLVGQTVGRLFTSEERRQQRQVASYFRRLVVALEDGDDLAGWQTAEDAAEACTLVLGEDAAADLGVRLGPASHNVLDVAIALGYDDEDAA